MGQDDRPPRVGGLRVLIAGGGVAGLEALLALRALAGELTRIEIVSPEPFFWYRPLAVAEPFEHVDTVRFEVSGVAEAADAVFTLDEIASVDTHARVARTRHGTDVEYDVLVLAHGALSRPWLPGALTFRGPADTDALEAVLREAEEGAARSIVFVGADGGAWPLPLYELALLTGRRLARRPAAEITLVTPEPTPLSLFGEAAWTPSARSSTGAASACTRTAARRHTTARSSGSSRGAPCPRTASWRFRVSRGGVSSASRTTATGSSRPMPRAAFAALRPSSPPATSRRFPSSRAVSPRSRRMRRPRRSPHWPAHAWRRGRSARCCTVFS